MNKGRRYDEEEIAEILRRATEADAATAPRPSESGRGLTLPEIQEIAGEVGIDAARVEGAARALDLPISAPESAPSRFLGAPRSVSRTVPLDRSLTDDEWMRLVALLRETFGAKGKVEQVGPLRTWYNGNLQVHVEPSADEYRLRMHTLKGNVTEFAIMGGAFLFLSILTGVLIFAKKGLDVGLIMSAMFGIVGLGALGTARLILPGWAKTRADQMASIAESVPRLMGE
jgi:hypothetical protein